MKSSKKHVFLFSAFILISVLSVFSACSGGSGGGESESGDVPVAGINLDKTSAIIAVGGTDQLTAIITPYNATDKNITWSSDDETIATVSEYGLVTGVDVGLTAITVTTEDGGFTAECIITVSSSSSGEEDKTPPSIPTGLSATAISESQINLSWNSSTDNVGVAGYRIYNSSGDVLKNITGTSTTMTGLSQSTEYCYMISAYDAAGNESGKSGQQCAWTFGPEPPAAPTGLTATALSSTTIQLTWTDNSDNETEFEIECAESQYVPYARIAGVRPNITVYNHIRLTASHLYRYRVRAINSAGNSTYSYASATTLDEPSTTVEFLPVRDNAVMYNSLNANVANTVYAAAELGAGNDFVFNLLYGYDVLSAASLLYFNVNSTIAGKTILRATLKLYPRVLPGDWNTVYRVYGLSGSWSASTVTWNNCPNWYEYPYAQQNPPVTTSMPVEWDVTQIAQAWASGSRVNYGLVVWDPYYTPNYTPALRMTLFDSMNVYNSLNRRPVLEIEYQ